MQELYKRLLKFRQNKDVAWETVEIDYSLSWILTAISRHEKLANSLIFKGGTALKKCYFGDYRFSEDLDFTEVVVTSNTELRHYIDEVLQIVKELTKSYGRFEFTLTEYLEKNPHPFNQAAFIVRVQLPWHRKPMTNIKLEISRDETMVFPPASKIMLHEYGETIDCKLQVYSLEEIVLEKFRAILQNREQLSRKKWIRSRVRDFYDLWRILGQYKNSLNTAELKEAFAQKCAIKNIIFVTSEQFFDDEYLDYIKKDWSEFLGRLIPELPEFDQVIMDLKKHVHNLL